VTDETLISFKVLQTKYQLLLAENRLLKKELDAFKAGLSITDLQRQEEPDYPREPESIIQHSDAASPSTKISNDSKSAEKIKLFMSLFKGRDDVYAKRWDSKKKGTAGYSPVCLNEWKQGVCGKPKVTCSTCVNKSYAHFDEAVVDNHLRGTLVAGIYPMLRDETCWFLAIDFDDGDWQKDISTLQDVCMTFGIPVVVERSRSGNGGHAWFFFEAPISATLARKFGTALLTHATNVRHEITFKSYDRFFPNQDTMPKGGLGNLIALPLQKEARQAGNSVFVDRNFQPYPDQWAFLGTIQKLTEDDVLALTTQLSPGSELGMVKQDEEEVQKPWETHRVVELQRCDFPREVEIVKANMLYIPKNGISQRALNRLKRLAVFKNPEFFKHQAMRISTYGKDRIICCADDSADYLCLPRGCEQEMKALLAEQGVSFTCMDKTNCGRAIAVEFNGVLRDEQPLALEKMLEHDIGVLSGTTAFGKTVLAIRLIAERKVNTLIIVDKVTLISQWKKRLQEFLSIHETLPEAEANQKKRGRKKSREIIGQLGNGKNTLSGIIDIALMQSLNKSGDVNECVKNYGMIIVDECHHAAAFSFEQVLKAASAKYVYGLTATPTRKDGHHPIIFMQCGPIRYRDDAKLQAEKRPFDHFIIPRFTSLRAPLGRNEQELTIQDYYSEIVVNEMRNQLIIDDVVNSHQQGRSCLVLTERTAHVKLLAKALSEKIPEVISLTGKMGTKVTGEIFKRISETPAERQLTLVATGKFIGEGFDEPRLDTLFLTMPISWKGTIQQYAGRLHRLFADKKEVQIYDYVDIHLKMLEKMYGRRLNGYASIGYKAKSGNVDADSIDIIFDNSSFLSVFNNDILAATREILIVSPFVTRRRTVQMLQHLEIAVRNGIRVVVITRPAEDYRETDQIASQGTLAILQDAGINMIFRPNIHQKFAVTDQRIVWYGSINLLSFGSAEESIMRLESSAIANELMKTVHN
jgi:superfamily II DNA or RNA helicase